ncbi:MAG: hypothetical protein IT537_19345 [Hyphomicrobiales bacterium]|nr:hypothetical protein [Hyphomicrobiales bacterium]
MPPPETLRAIVSQLGKRLPPNTTVFTPTGAPADAGLCKMQPFRMTLGRGLRSSQTYSVLLDPQKPSAPVEPAAFFIVVNRMTVDADGSPRSYHPEDPYGAGRCEPARQPDGSTALSGVCAVDAFPSGNILLFRGSKKLTRPDLAPQWSRVWPLIRDRTLKSISVSSVAGPNVAEGFYFFHWRAENLTAVLRDTIIPKTKDGYPCRHEGTSPYAGYFLSATTLVDESAPTRDDGCRPGHYMDSEKIPFIVLPRGGFGKVGIGDIAIVRMEAEGKSRIVYAIVGDGGPAHRIGEGSIALNQSLLSKSGTVMNTRDVYAIDISGRAISMLVLGGTRALFNGDYSPQNIRTVAAARFRQWSGGGSTARLDACVRLLGEARR